MRGLVEVRGRLEKVKKEKEGRGRLVGAILGQDSEIQKVKRGASTAAEHKEKKEDEEADEESDTNLIELDRRISELEGLIGSSSIALDEASTNNNPFAVTETLIQYITGLAFTCASTPNAHQIEHPAHSPHPTATP